MTKDDSTWLNVFYAAFGVIIAIIAWNIITMTGEQMGWIERYHAWFPAAANIAGIAVGIAAAFILRGKAERHEYLLGSIGELRKVTWPSSQDTKRMTIVVVIVVCIFAVILSAFDFVWSRLLGLMLV